jgi:hypothetical protein
VGEVCFEGEELLHVDQTGGESELEQVPTVPSVAGLPETVHLQFCDVAFHERSSPELGSCCWSGLFISCSLETSLVEAQPDRSTSLSGGALCAYRTAVTAFPEFEGRDPSPFALGVPAGIGGRVPCGACC